MVGPLHSRTRANCPHAVQAQLSTTEPLPLLTLSTFWGELVALASHTLWWFGEYVINNNGNNSTEWHNVPLLFQSCVSKRHCGPHQTFTRPIVIKDIFTSFKFSTKTCFMLLFQNLCFQKLCSDCTEILRIFQRYLAIFQHYQRNVNNIKVIKVTKKII